MDSFFSVVYFFAVVLGILFLVALSFLYLPDFIRRLFGITHLDSTNDYSPITRSETNKKRSNQKRNDNQKTLVQRKQTPRTYSQESLSKHKKYFLASARQSLSHLVPHEQSPHVKYPFLKPKPIFTPAETKFYYFLHEITDGKFTIMANVRLLDLIDISFFQRIDRSSALSIFHKTKSKHVDYLLVDKNLKIVCAIELNDSSHDRPDRVKRDALIDDVLSSAGVPIVWVPFAWTYDRETVISNIVSTIHPTN
ncbi:MAG: DUF2726 domain-containing protein [Hydrogenovibrio sp.]|uniref:DUF2726 domain-containing protein n=1 Tax=Hydrogenovibrio sp. TaxID=2065821 RepID=UPI0028704166|nr:DUF2726 domain-containing protein [Hydrogenovibrio sp.]MDR9499808.1 DUF2726 domain-containing protein [Hydrogenovibrio sp.]